MHRASFLVFFAGMALVIAGCSTTAPLLPKSQETADFYWQAHKEVEAAHKMIVPGKTTRLQKVALGFDPKRVPNTKRIEYLEVRDMLLGKNPNTKIEDLPEGAQECLAARELCVAEIYKVGITRSDDEGNFIANKTDYRVITRTTGWSFNTTIFIKKIKKDQESDDDLVVYLSKDDDPKINKVKTKEDKMGPVKTLIFGPIRGFLSIFGIP